MLQKNPQIHDGLLQHSTPSPRCRIKRLISTLTTRREQLTWSSPARFDRSPVDTSTWGWPAWFTGEEVDPKGA